MKANRKTMLGVAFAVAVIALAGVGYAAYDGYTATTTNTGNTVGTVYNKITLGSNTAADYTSFMLDDGIEFDSVTDAAVTTYSFHNLDTKIKLDNGTYSIDNDIQSATAVKISDDLVVTVDASHGGAGALFLKVNKTFVLGNNVTFLVKADSTFYLMSDLVVVGVGNGTQIDTFSNAANQTTTISVYAYVGNSNSFDLEANTNVLSGVTFTFTAIEGIA